MGATVHTGEYRVLKESYDAHPAFNAVLRSVEKALTRNAWIQSDLKTFRGIIRDKIGGADLHYDETARILDYQHLYLTLGIFAHCKAEKRYYFDHEVAERVRECAKNGQRLPTYKGNRIEQLTQLKVRANVAKPRDHLKSVPMVKEDSSDAENEASVQVSESSSSPITEPPTAMISQMPTLADALTAIELIESEGARKGVYLVEEQLIFEIRDALLGQAIAPDYTNEINSLRQEILSANALAESAKASAEAANAQCRRAESERDQLRGELDAHQARDQQEVASVLSELKGLPLLLKRAEQIVSPTSAAEAMPFKTALQQRYEQAVREQDKLKTTFDYRNRIVQEHAAELEELAMRIQKNFSLTPEQVTEKQLNESEGLRSLFSVWTEIREKITTKRKEFELDTLEEKISEASTLVRAYKTVLTATPAK